MDRFNEGYPTDPSIADYHPDEPDSSPEDEFCPIGHLIVCGAPSVKTMMAHMREHEIHCSVCRGEEEVLPVLESISIKVALPDVSEWSKEVA